MANPQIENGYIKISRKIIDHEVFQNDNTLKVFLWCLVRALHTDEPKKVRGVMIGKGQFIYGRFAASEQLKMSPSTLYKVLKRLEKLKVISMKGGKRFTVITVVSYEVYQSGESYKGNEKEMKRKSTGNESSTNKNVKNEKNYKKENIKRKIVLPDWMPEKPWEDYLEHRGKFKPSMTDRAKELLIIRIAKLGNEGHSPEKLLNKSIEKGWKDVYPDDDTLRDNFEKPAELAY